MMKFKLAMIVVSAALFLGSIGCSPQKTTVTPKENMEFKPVDAQLGGGAGNNKKETAGISEGIH